MSNSPNLNLTYLAASQAQKHVTVNEALRVLDALCNLTIIDRNLTSPPGSPGEGDCYIVASTGADGWAGHDLEIAFYADSAWQFVTPRNGWKAFIVDEQQFVYWSTDASPDAWVDMPGYGGSSVGVSAEGSLVGTRGEINLVEGNNVAITVTDNSGDGRVDVTLSATAAVDFATLSNTATAGDDLLLFADVSDSDTVIKRTLDEVIADKGIALGTHDHDTAYAAISHTHSASDITAGTFADGRIAESNVTQHQAALSITESQISDLGTYATASHDHDSDYAALDADNDFGGFALSNYTVSKTVQTASYSLTAADSGTVIEIDHASGATVTVPGSLPTGFICELAQVGAGQVTVAAGSGATMRQRQGHTKTAGQWAAAIIRVRSNAGGSAAEFVLAGDTAS